MPAPYGNDNHKKLKTQELRDKVYKDYCDHIASGESQSSWYYDKDGILLTWQAMEEYITRVEVDPSHKKIAYSKAQKIWEHKGIDMMIGKYEKCSPAIYQMFMRNKFSWDKRTEVDKTATPEHTEADFPKDAE